MGEIVNLNRYRKSLNRREKEISAQENRTKHGRTKVEREKDREEAVRRAQDQDGKELE